MARAAILSGPERRRRWTSVEKHRIVEESLAADTAVVEVARRHEVHPNLLHLWRRQARSGSLAVARQPNDAPGVQFTSVAIAADERVLGAPPRMIEIEFASGTRLRITGLVDAATVSAAIAAATRGERRR